MWPNCNPAISDHAALGVLFQYMSDCNCILVQVYSCSCISKTHTMFLEVGYEALEL